MPARKVVTNVKAETAVLGTQFNPDVLGFSAVVTQGKIGKSGNLEGQTRRYRLNSKRQLSAEFAPEIGGALFDGTHNVSYCRDELGQLTGKSLGAACATAASANLLTNSFDSRNRLSITTFAGNSAPSESYSYSNGNVELIERGDGVILDPEYNEIDQLKSQDYVVDGYKFRVRFEYDTMQNIKALVYPSGKRIAITADTLSRIIKVLPYVTNVEYFEIGAPKAITYANGQRTDVTLSSQNLIDGMKTEFGSTVAVNLDYGHDLNGNPTSVQDFLNPNDNLEARYDQLNRLTKQNYVNLPNGQNMYRSYDSLGNILFDRSPDGDVNFNYDASTNRLLSASSSNSAFFPNRSFSYDRLGNMQSDGVRTLTFNSASELMNGTRAGQSKSIKYDGAERIIREASNGETHYFIHLGENLILDFNATTNKYTEYTYLGSQLIGSRVVSDAATNDSDADGKSDLLEFTNPD